MFDNANRGEPPKPLAEIDVLRQQRANLMIRLLDMEVMLAMQEDELKRLRQKTSDTPEPGA
jgi:hypothetical protein